MVIGEEIGEAAPVECIRPKNAPTSALPGLIRRRPQRSGMSLLVERSVAARSSVLELHHSSWTHRAAYFSICASFSRGYQMKWPGGFTPTSTERWMLFG